MNRTRELMFRGHPYSISFIDPTPYHPSWFSFEDESTVRDALWTIEPGDVVLDVGADHGSYTLTALACGAAHVYAWTPPEREPAAHGFLEESLRLNGWSDRCDIMTTGVYDRSGWLDTFSQEFFEAEPEMRPTIIRVDSLDDWRRGLELPKAHRSWMKLDVEGAEVNVLRGAAKMIGEMRPRITVENHNFKRASLEQEVRDLLVVWDYIEVSTTPYHSVSHSLYVPREDENHG